MLFIERYFYIHVGVDQATEGTNTKWNFHLYASAVFGTSCVTVWQMYFKIIILSEILTITFIFSNALKLFVIGIV